MFTRNEGKIERVIRVSIGLVVLATAFIVLSGTMQWVLAAVGVILLLTGIVGFCPLYTIIGKFTSNEQMCPTCTPEENAANQRSNS
jgi:hypothetical protein